MAIQILAQTPVNLTSAGTAEAIGSGLFKDVVLVADPAKNTGTLYIGGPDVDSTNGIPLAAGEKLAMNALFNDSRSPDLQYDLSTIYVDGDTTNDDLRIITFNILGPRAASGS
jgi:hypothetical protein